jgi:iron complex outermembrane recepter protein
MTNKRRLCCFISAAAVSLATGAVGAQAQAALEEVIVTAERTEKSLQETPISVVALNSDALDRLGVSTIADLGSSVPNLKVMSFGISATTLRFYIRGIGTVDSQITLDSPVGIYMDGVYMARSVGLAVDVADIERVEVLRGPQGTLFGRNTTGGAVNVVTRRPGEELGFTQLLSGGDYGLFKSRTSVNLPLGDSAAAKLTYQKHKRDGWIENEGSGDDFHAFDRDAVRADLRWNPTDDITVDYSYDDSQNDFTGNYYHLLEVSSNFTGVLPPVNGRQDKAKLLLPYEESSAESSGHTLTVSIDTDIGVLKSITAYREVEEDVYQDYSGNDFLPVFRNNRFNADQDQFSQEFQLSGAACDDRIDYIAGLYYFEESGREVSGDEVTFISLLLPRDVEADNETWAAYAQVGWRPSQGSPWKISLGGRYTEDEREGNNNILPAASESWQNFTPSLTAMYELSANSNLYAKVASGYKAGGFNLRQNDFSESYDEETLISYELGWKTELMDRRLRWNGAIFYSDYDDMQLDILLPNQPSPIITQTQNAGTAELMGLETELSYMLTDRVRLDLSYGYLDSEINEVEGDDANLYALPNAPKHMVSGTIDWQIAKLQAGDLSFAMDYNWQDDSVTGVRRLVGIDMDAYAVAGARLQLMGEDWFGKGGYTVSGWVRNMFDEEYFVDTFGSFNSIHANRVAAYGDPRTWGVNVEYRY